MYVRISCCIARVVCVTSVYTHHQHPCDCQLQAAGLSRAVACSTAGLDARRHACKQRNPFVPPEHVLPPLAASSPLGLSKLLRRHNATHQTLQLSLFPADWDVPLLTRLPHEVLDLYPCINPDRHSVSPLPSH